MSRDMTRVEPRRSWIDRAIEPLAPRWVLQRTVARMKAEILARHYEAASTGRRTQGWRRSTLDANAAVGPALTLIRDAARDLVRNNPYAESALGTIADHAVGWGIVGKTNPMDQRAQDAWKAWAESTDCDADGRHDFYGLQKLVMRTVVESGEVLVRQRIRYLSDGFALPMQLQVIDPDFIDTLKDNSTMLSGAGTGNRIIQGVEFDAIGRRVAYWLFPSHPGSALGMGGASVRVPADGIRHIFRSMRPGQVRGISWFAPVLLGFRDFAEFADATLMKQKIAACLAVLTSDTDGSNSPLGTASSDGTIDTLEPGAILNVAPGRTIEVVQPPQAGDYSEYSKTVLRSIATGLGVTYEDLTGDYENLPFSAARMSRIRHWARVEDWRWRILIPQFCTPAWQWAMQVAQVMGRAGSVAPGVEWTAQPAPMIDPVNEGLAYQRNIRSGMQTLSDALRERGYDPDTVLKEMAADNKKLDELGLILDSDARNMTQAGQLQGEAAKGLNPVPAPAPPAPAAPADPPTPPKKKAATRR